MSICFYLVMQLKIWHRRNYTLGKSWFTLKQGKKGSQDCPKIQGNLIWLPYVIAKYLYLFSDFTKNDRVILLNLFNKDLDI